MNPLSILIYPGVIFMFATSLLLYGVIRKLTARMHSRIGPPIWQPFLDIIKLIGKENIRSESAKSGFTLWPVLALSSIIMAGLLIPVAGISPLGPSVDLITIMYFLVLSSLCIYLAGFSSGNPFTMIGSGRGLVQLLSYEFPFITSILVPILSLQTLSPIAVNQFQIDHGSLLPIFPFAAIAFFFSILAKTETPPFHVPAAHQEIVGGYTTEYTGIRLAFLELTHMVKIFLLISLSIALFFGGSGDIISFFIKTAIIVFLISLFKVFAARFRIEHVLKFNILMGLLAFIDLIRVLVFA